MLPSKTGYGLFFWFVIIMFVAGAFWFLKTREIEPVVPTYPDEAQQEQIDTYHADNTPTIIYTSENGAVVYEFTDGTVEKATESERVKNGEPILTPTQTVAIGNMTTTNKGAWLGIAKPTTVGQYNLHLTKLRWAIVVCTILGFMIGRDLGLRGAPWPLMTIIVLVFMAATAFAIMLQTDMVRILSPFILAAVMLLSYLTFVGQGPQHKRKKG